MNRIGLEKEALGNSYNLRIFLLLGVIAVFTALIISKLFLLQIRNHQLYLAQASVQHGNNNTIPARRGEIYFGSVANNNQPVLAATNVNKDLVFAIGKEMSDTDRQTAANKLGPILQIAPKDLLQRLVEANQNYYPIKKQLSDEDSDKIKELHLKGIYLQGESVRFYPQNNLASQVLGFVGFKGDDRVGQYGVEGKFEKELAGTPGIAVPPKNLLNADEDGLDQILPAVDGSNIYLTIDPNIQFKAQQVVSTTVQQHGADKGSVIVINPKTGAVLAMANYPDFDPNQYNKVDSAAVYNNDVLTSDYEPGSVFKAITMAAGLNEEKITPQSTYNDTGSIQVDDRTIKNSDPKPLGIQTMTQVLDESLNTGAVFVQQQVGHDKFKEYLQKFGFGKPTGFDLAESNGDINNLNQKGDVFYATASFGQGITVTPLQLIQAYTAIANGGQMVKPYVVDRIVKPDGEVDERKPTKLNQVLDPKTASTLSAMLVDVVENGHGKKAGVPGYYIGGKTGTAQVANVGKAGYDPNKNIGSFIGFGPVENPAFLMLVRIDNPRDVKFAESTAAPAFGEIANYILNYLQIPPTRQ